MPTQMRVMFNSQERTLRELTELARESGWEVAHVARSQGTLWAYTTLVPV